MKEVLLPDGWERPSGYSNGIKAHGDVVFVAGQIGWDASETLVGDDIVSQAEQALKNIVAVLKSGGASADDIVRMTWYVVDIDAYRAARQTIGERYRDVIGRVFPAMTLVQVAALLEPGALVEIEVTAVVGKGADA